MNTDNRNRGLAEMRNKIVMRNHTAQQRDTARMLPLRGRRAGTGDKLGNK
jgi:hypothetical protein